ncbi:MAG: hypothetical protein HFF26_10745 [Oscillospiraceae bacterium]|nr:hypothetical protein [Oscillospiraceae bacterium]
MWLSGQHKRPAESGEGQTGIVTISGGETAVLLDRERRGLEVYSPAGYFWTPRVGQRVLVIQGRGEIPCVVGARQDGGVPDRVDIRGRSAALSGETVTIEAETAAVQGGEVDLKSEVFVQGMPLREYIAAIVREILAGVG